MCAVSGTKSMKGTPYWGRLPGAETVSECMSVECMSVCLYRFKDQEHEGHALLVWQVAWARNTV